MTTRLRDLHTRALEELRYEPTERRVRADAAVDSTSALLVWEPRRIVPAYAVPRTDLLEPIEPHAPTEAAVGELPPVLHPGIPFAVHTAAGSPLTIGGRAGAGFALDDLPGYVVLDGRAFEAWYEEDERVFGHPRDPYHRVDVRETSRPVRIEADGTVLADSTRARLLFETNLPTRYYVPKEDVVGELVASPARSYCPYKGEASYWSVGGRENVAWSYETPLPDGPPIAGLVAFWGESVQIHVDSERAGVEDDAGAVAVRRDDFGL